MPDVPAPTVSVTPSSIATPAFRQPKPVLRWLGFIVAAAGWYVSLQLLLLTGGAPSPLMDALCRANDDCASVLRSEWAYMGKRESALAIPLSAVGMAYFAFIGLWFAFVGPPTRARWGWHAALLLLLGIGGWLSIDMLRIMSSVLHRWCLGCVIAHSLNGVLIILAIAAWPWRNRRTTPVPPHPSTRLALATIFAGLAVFVGHVLAVWFVGVNGQLKSVGERYMALMNDPAFVQWDHARQPHVEIPPRDDGTALGSPDAPHRVVAFIDFQCPACRQAHDVLEQLHQRHGDRVRVEFRHYPADPACNSEPRWAKGGHPVACKAARAAEAALAVGGPPAFHAIRAALYESQERLESTGFTFAAAIVRAANCTDEAALKAFHSAAAAARVAEDVELARKIGVESPPAIFLDGRKVSGWKKIEIWEALLGLSSASGEAGTQPSSQPQ